MGNIWRFIVRTSAFVGKELMEVIRQTPLILTLVLGPFLVLLLFGVGYSNEARPLRTLFYMQDDDPFLRQQIESNVENIGPQLVYLGITNDEQEAIRRLNQGDTDLIVAIPANAMQSLRNNEQVTVTLYHDEIDPYQVAYVQSFGSTYVEAINQRILRDMAAQGQQEITDTLPQIDDAYQQADTMQQTLEQGQQDLANQDFDTLTQTMDTLLTTSEGNLGLLAGISSSIASDGNSANSQNIEGTITEMRTEMDALKELKNSGGDVQQSIQRLDELKNQLQTMRDLLTELQSVEPQVIIAPFISQISTLAQISITPELFFAPGVVILLLQHLAVTFASLTIVREIRLGSMEVFRISPISAFEILLGKYISYILIGSVLEAAITLTLIYALGMPMLGSWTYYAAVLLLVIFTSIGMGFVISLVAKTDIQAVQYAMFLLLGSVFFSGFFMDLRYFVSPVREISYALPATYGIQMLQDIMLRGKPIPLNLLIPLAAIGMVLFLLVWFFLRRRMQSKSARQVRE